MRVEFHQTKNGLSRLMGTINEVEGGRSDFFINRFHAFAGERPGVLDLSVGARFDDAARAKSFFLNSGSFG